MFRKLLDTTGIDSSRYEIKPFNIKDSRSFDDLDPTTPNLVNVYSEWSEKKVALFAEHGLKVIKLDMPKHVPVSGTLIREIISTHEGTVDSLSTRLVSAGFMPDAVPGLLHVLDSQHWQEFDKNNQKKVIHQRLGSN